MRYDALVIGAGMSGLAAGIRLAQAGQRVAVLERHYLWGGLNSFYKRAGRRLDVGLHALTNFVPRGTPNVPLTRLLRQLRIPYDALQLAPQRFSETVFRIDGALVRLRYSNDFELMRSEVARLFPSERDGFDELVAALPGYSDDERADASASAREKLREFVRDPLLAEMLLVAPSFYGSPREHDMSWFEFGVLFRSLHLEGLARPDGGVKRLLDLLVARLGAEGGELRTRCGVSAIVVADGAARGVVLDDGTHIEAESVFSSAGLVETRALCGLASDDDARDVGRLSFVETLCVLAREPAALGHEATITFFNDGPRFEYERPDGLIDVRSGVVNSPNNYLSRAPLADGLLRVTSLASHPRWTALDDADYAREKRQAFDAVLSSAARFSFDPRPHVVWHDLFTPRTIERFTGHRGGAVYGSPRKCRDGSIGVPGLHLIGTDQGLVGIVGALLSGIGIVNRVALAPQRGRP